MSEVVYDVAVVGGGLAGLGAAIEVVSSGRKCLLIEAEDRFGGKVASDTDEEGYTYDRGFQVLFTSYEELALPLLEWTRIPQSKGLGYFSPGAIVAGYGCIDRNRPLRTLIDSVVSVRDLIKLLQLNRVATTWKRMNREGTALNYLQCFGFSEKFIDRFAKPFIGGITLDRTLSISANQFLKIWHYLATGKVGLPEAGIGQLPNYLLSQAIGNGFEPQLRTTVNSVHSEPDIFRIETTKGQFRARSMVLASGPHLAKQILNREFHCKYRSSNCLYFSSNGPLTTAKYIVLNPKSDAVVNHFAPITNVCPSYAPKGMHLTSVTVLGNRPETDQELAEIVLTELKDLCTDVISGLEFRRCYRIHEAQLDQQPGFEDLVPNQITDLPGIFLAGEMTTSSTINDAISGGRSAARLAVNFQGGKVKR